MEPKDIKLTPARLVFLRTLKDGPRTWKDIKAAYYGPERSQSKSHNSFQQQKNKLLSKGLIQEEDGHYELTDFGRQVLAIASEESLVNAKTIAQQKFEENKENKDA